MVIAVVACNSDQKTETALKLKQPQKNQTMLTQPVIPLHLKWVNPNTVKLYSNSGKTMIMGT